jgi:AAA15 family ATPase/GTPase
MKLVISDLGNIRKAEIDITKKFYVFVGYNNSGKTYMAQLLWSLFEESTIYEFTRKFNLESLGESNEYKITNELVDNILSSFSEFFKEEILPDVYNVKKDHFIIKDCKVKFEYNFEEFKNLSLEKVDPVLIPQNELSYYKINKVKGDNIINLSDLQIEPDEKAFLEKFRGIAFKSRSNLLVDFILNLVLSNVHEPFYLPASRSFYPIFYQYIFKVEKEKREAISKRIQNAWDNLNLEENLTEKLSSETFKRLFSSFKSPYTRPMNLLIDSLQDLNLEELKVKPFYQPLLSKLKSVLGGDISPVRKVEGISPIEFLLKIDEEKELDMYLSSSSVNQLTTLDLYLKYWAKERGNFLFVDEPEENLHPENQIKILEILLSFATQNNNRVLITTHSPLLADSINNFINLGYLAHRENFNFDSFARANNIPYRKEDLLSKEDYAVYFFGDSQVIEYEAKDYGVNFASFVQVEQSIRRLSETITDEIYELKEKEEEEHES